MLRIGLTGGMGSGKSTVAALFAARGVPVIDTDEIAHRLTRPGEPAAQLLLSAFGPDIAAVGGGIDRRRLAERIFANQAERQKLQTILHPAIFAAMDAESGKLKAPYCLLVIPLLAETEEAGRVDRVLVVDADDDARLGRVRERDQRSDAEIRAIFAAQTSRAERLGIADDVISNNGDRESLESQVEQLHHQYLELAAAASGL